MAKTSNQIIHEEADRLECENSNLRTENASLRRQLAKVEAARREAGNELRRIRDQQYDPMTRHLNRLYTADCIDSHLMQTRVLRIQPKYMQFAISNIAADFASNPISVVNEGIEEMLRMHADHLRTELRNAYWEACR